MVEGKTDEKVLSSFSRVLGSPIDQKMTRILVGGGKSDAKNFSPILTFAVSNKECIIVLDNDGGKPKDVKDSILNIERNYRAKIDLGTPLLADKNFYLLPERVYSIEYYLLEPEAICKAFNCTEPQTIMKIRKEIDNNLVDIEKKIIKPKDLLKQICERHFQNYHDA
jgi:predicted ATP-dependent endonuclease of OLD family